VECLRSLHQPFVAGLNDIRLKKDSVQWCSFVNRIGQVVPGFTATRLRLRYGVIPLLQFCKANDTITKTMHAPSVTGISSTPPSAPATSTPSTTVPPSMQPARNTPAGATPASTTPKQRVCYWCQTLGNTVSTCPEKAVGKRKVKRVKTK